MTQTLQTLIESLHHLDRSAQSEAALALGKLGDLDAVDALIQALCTDTDLLVREDITWALVRLREGSFAPVLALLKDSSAAVRHNAAHVLGKMADPRAVDGLINALGDTDDAVVLKAAFALSQIRDESAIPALVRILGHKNTEVQSMLTQVLEGFSPASIEPLVEALNDARWQVREHAADALGAIGAKETIPALTALLRDENWEVRFAAVTALGNIGGAKAKLALCQMPQDTNVRVQTLAEKLLSTR